VAGLFNTKYHWNSPKVLFWSQCSIDLACLLVAFYHMADDNGSANQIMILHTAACYFHTHFVTNYHFNEGCLTKSWLGIILWVVIVKHCPVKFTVLILQKGRRKHDTCVFVFFVLSCWNTLSFNQTTMKPPLTIISFGIDMYAFNRTFLETVSHIKV